MKVLQNPLRPDACRCLPLVERISMHRAILCDGKDGEEGIKSLDRGLVSEGIVEVI